MVKQAPKAWYERIRIFLAENGFPRGHVDTTLFRKYCSDVFVLV